MNDAADLKAQLDAVEAKLDRLHAFLAVIGVLLLAVLWAVL
ncbi:MAG: hypothetical protein ACU0BS_00685 [Hasllibacter sp.]